MSKKEELLTYLKDHVTSDHHPAMVLVNRQYIIDIVEELVEPTKIKAPIWVVSNGNGKHFCKFTGEGVSGIWVSSNIIPYMFDEKEKAEAVALLTGGTVELI
ncbi:hypothetical protein P7D66_08550 [Enterococcus avium]|uniref:hypothetical protein n=1 Tax=Enterococcus avium TaxID=33945 RepID=UPI00288F24D4|nr:hypothetical protein [Enterococcus avium]MDT2422425.1 hypothetical protein [Enterococcus avium]